MSEAIMPTRSLFIYPGYRSVCVLAAMTVETFGSDQAQSNNISLCLRTHELISLVKSRCLNMQPICRYPRQCAIVQDNDRVSVVR